MTNNDPNLDLTVPFEVSKIIRAAKHIYSREHFDKFLLAKPDQGSTAKSGRKSLGAKGNLPSGYIVSLLWVLKQFAQFIPSR